MGRQEVGQMDGEGEVGGWEVCRGQEGRRERQEETEGFSGIGKDSE